MPDLDERIHTSLSQSVAEAAKYLMAHKERLVVLLKELDTQIAGHSYETLLGDLTNTTTKVPSSITPSYWRLVGLRRLSLNSLLSPLSPLLVELAEALADLLQSHKDSLMRRLMVESGKTIVDAQSEVPEAIDFCHYYSVSQARILATQEAASVCPKGIALCISPWSFSPGHSLRPNYSGLVP